ncbi:hypothetical protein ACIBAI_24040 [Streptomyces sp. NPDC051041]|uniref:effector-associated constant component EACC1 n=1 Tax=Streptomyces sp. NPDC051041 TaxID=3365640 RepID=UPI00379D74F4
MGSRLQVRFEAAGPDAGQELRSLLDWFTDDRSLRGHVRLERIAADVPGRMGPDLETVLAVISTATGLAQLPLSYLAWRHGRGHRTPPVTVHVVGADPAEAEALLRRLRGTPAGDAPDDGAGPGDAGEAGDAGGDGGAGGDRP